MNKIIKIGDLLIFKEQTGIRKMCYVIDIHEYSNRQRIIVVIDSNNYEDAFHEESLTTHDSYHYAEIVKYD